MHEVQDILYDTVRPAGKGRCKTELEPSSELRLLASACRRLIGILCFLLRVKQNLPVDFVSKTMYDAWPKRDPPPATNSSICHSWISVASNFEPYQLYFFTNQAARFSLTVLVLYKPYPGFVVPLSSRLPGDRVEIRIRIEGMVFLHDLQVVSHLFPLFGSQGGQLGTFVGSILGRPLGKFPGFPVVFGCIQVGFRSLAHHGVAAILEIRNLEHGSDTNDASDCPPNSLVGGQSPKPLEHVG